ncbi:MAG: GNAT family N-acetyltransferase [Marinilabiliaceae bacterium]|nr:GNAT family N-acetyltransferase [Marinilabiliaceae bacterium]
MPLTDFLFCDYENPTHLQELARMLNHYMADPMGGAEPLNKLQQLRLVDGLANHPASFVLFITVDDQVAGMATCFINFSTFRVKPYINVHDIVVDARYRGQGLGRQLMQRIIGIAAERDYCKVTLEVRDDNAVAQSLYRSLGFDECEPRMFYWQKVL